MSAELPEGWAKPRLDDIATSIQYGFTASADHGRSGPRFLRITDIQDDRVEWSKVPGCKLSSDDLEKYRLAKGDIVFARSGATTGKSFLIRETPPDAVFASYLIRVRANHEVVEPGYLARFFQSPEYWSFITDNVAGNAQPNCNGSKLAALPIALPPLPEQRRIVSRVESLLARVNAARERLEKVPVLLKQFRQAVLAKAFRGELVPTEAQLAAREGRYYQSAAELLGQPANGGSEDLPEGWASVTVDELLPPGGLFDGPFGSSLKTSDYTDAGVRVIRLENIANLRFVADKETWISESKYQQLQRHTVGEGDIIFGSFVDESCRVCVLPRLPTPAIAKADCFCMRPRDELVDRTFLVYQLGSVATRNALVEEVHGATRPRINTGQLRALSVVLPPLPEQRRIVVKVEALVAAAAKVEAEAERQLKLLERAPQTILQKAFSSELVTTEAELAAAEGRAFESAEALLRRVKDAPVVSRTAELDSPRRARRRKTSVLAEGS